MRKFDLCKKLFKARDFIGSKTKLVVSRKHVNESIDSFFISTNDVSEMFSFAASDSIVDELGGFTKNARRTINGRINIGDGLLYCFGRSQS